MLARATEKSARFVWEKCSLCRPEMCKSWQAQFAKILEWNSDLRYAKRNQQHNKTDYVYTRATRTRPTTDDEFFFFVFITIKTFHPETIFVRIFCHQGTDESRRNTIVEARRKNYVTSKKRSLGVSTKKDRRCFPKYSKKEKVGNILFAKTTISPSRAPRNEPFAFGVKHFTIILKIIKLI